MKNNKFWQYVKEISIYIPGTYLASLFISASLLFPEWGFVLGWLGYSVVVRANNFFEKRFSK